MAEELWTNREGTFAAIPQKSLSGGQFSPIPKELRDMMEKISMKNSRNGQHNTNTTSEHHPKGATHNTNQHDNSTLQSEIRFQEQEDPQTKLNIRR